ncbi:MAG TPA: hypothetical protein VFS42_12265 [Burkholderiaceae bacterium]|nr:hypothetical protein [Burkholderiaceae bacterium]
MNANPLLTRIKAYDDQRPSLPGEHLLTFGTGAALLMSSMRRQSGLGRMLTMLAAGALIYRAASGRDGIAKWLKK